MKTIAIDWAYKKPLAIYDGLECKILQIKQNENVEQIIKYYSNDIEVVCENLPHLLCRAFLECGINVYTIHPNLVKSYKDQNNIENPDDDAISAQCIYEIYQQSPEFFRQVIIDVRQESLRNVVKSFIDIQRTRIKIDQRNNIKSKFIESDSIDTKILEKEEAKIQKQMENILNSFPVYTNFLCKIKGVGTIISAKLLSYIDIRKANKPSAMIKYCGLGVTDGEADHKAAGKLLTYNPELKTICLGHLGETLIKLNHEKYRQIYDNAKERYIGKYGDEATTSAKSGDRKNGKWNKMRVHLTARRIMVKQFLSDFWSQWRKSEGLSFSYPYAIDVLGHRTYITDDPIKLLYVELQDINKNEVIQEEKITIPLKPLRKVERQIKFE